MAVSSTNYSFLIAVFAFVTMLLMFPNKVKSAQSLSFSFSRFGPDHKDLIFQGDAISTNNVLQLTKLDSAGNPLSGSVGRVLYSAPLHLWENSAVVSSFETSFTFQISTPYTSPPADGVAFFLAPYDTVIPSNSGGSLLGLFSNLNALRNSSTSQNQTILDFKAVSNKVVAVEFDTYPNENIGDPAYKHIGIDVNSIRSKTTARWNWQNGKTATAHISYNSASKRLTVSTFYPGSNPVTLSYDVELHTVLSEWVRVGFSASSGEQKERNTILSWSFTSSLKNNEVKDEKQDMFIKTVV
ncbi:flt3 receptor-interacting lectin-like [Vigna radiata var. radiata]|uniref:Flt3 receptor-interacting lectin-like n=1 Tax=Vigna radiata var. radiata TaxID=3916 RepID=A0A1S3V2P1_VIGRR|nr:flt3 receptor-interacting lectin-like [Vigna radiata var. radiata]